MRVILKLDFKTAKWSAWLEDADNMQVIATLGPFDTGMDAAQSLFANIGGEPCTIPAWALDEYVGG